MADTASNLELAEQMVTKTSKRFFDFPLVLRLNESKVFAIAAVVMVAIGLSLGASSTALAQQAGSTAAHRVATIDIAFIFKNLPAIQSRVQSIEAELKAYETELKQKRETLKQAVAKLKAFETGSPEFNRQEEVVAKLDSQLRLDMSRRQSGIRSAETEIYFENYQKILAAVRTIAKHNNIQLVLRSNNETMDVKKSETVTRGIQKNVVYRDESIDMTQMVMQFLQRSTAQHSSATPAPSATRAIARR